MRWSMLSRVATLSFAALALGARKPALRKEVESDAWGKPIQPSTFNDQEVPPFLEYDGATFQDTIAKGYWFIEFFSPYCHHCKAFAPTLQTFYELYYTSSHVPVATDSDPFAASRSFTSYYNFHFGKMNCAPFGETCAAAGVKSFPTLVLYKDGEEVKKTTGEKRLSDLSSWMEEVLEDIKPGSRPAHGLALPKVGADHVEEFDVPASQVAGKGTASKAKAILLEEEETEIAPKKAGPAKAPLVEEHGFDVLPKKAGAGKAAPIEEEFDAGLGRAALGKAGLVDPSSDSEVTLSSIDKATKKQLKPIKTKHNPSGKSVVLSAQDFTVKVTSTRDPWFIKFYAPWCPHCQHLAPTWNSVARDMEGKLNIGEVNCEVEKRLCKDVHIKGYPTLLYFQGGDRLEYEGLRGLGDLLSFTNKAVDAVDGVKDVTAKEFEEMEKTEEVIFLYMYDHATTSEDFLALERLAMPLIGRARLVKTNDKDLFKRFKISTWPRLLVSRDGKPSYFTPLAPRDMRDVEKVLGWMRQHWMPIVPEMTSANAGELMAGKLVVLGILSRDRADEFIIAKREIKNAALEWIDKQTQAFQLERQELRDAKQLRIEEAEDRDDQRALRNAKSIRINMDDIERKEVAFAWVDGVFWERWIKTTYGINVKEGERVVVNDEDNHRYWDLTVTGNPIVPSRTSILETLPKIVANPPKLSPKSTASFFGHIYFSLRRAFLAHPILTVGAVVILLIAAVLWFRGPSAASRRQAGSTAPFAGEKKGWGNTGAFFQLPLNGKDVGSSLGGLLGNNGGEKAD